MSVPSVCWGLEHSNLFARGYRRKDKDFFRISGRDKEFGGKNSFFAGVVGLVVGVGLDKLW